MNEKDNYFKMICTFYAIMIVIGLIFRSIYYKDVVNSKQLHFVTPLQENQVYHPKVLSFENEWNGYKYWIAFTPYPNTSQNVENPVINASNNMIDWVEPKGINNPLDIPNPVSSKQYNSGTHLLYNSDLDRLELFWRYVNDLEDKVIIYMIYSSDGINWSNKEAFLESDERSQRDFVSPAIILENGVYKIWYVDKKEVHYIEKHDDKISDPVTLNIKYKNDYRTWNIDVIYNEDKNIYEMLMVAYQNVNHRESMDLYYTSSADNESWENPTRIMKHSTDEELWDSQGLYRSSLLYDEDSGKYYVFYSGHDAHKNTGIGLMCGEDIKKLKSCN